MLDLVRQETERVESRFLEPACGDGNFLAEVLARKLAVIRRRYRRSRPEYERNAIVAVGSLYGIDIQEDNVSRCRGRLYSILECEYRAVFGKHAREDCLRAARFVLERNIVWGDALTLQTVGPEPAPIVFAEWTPVNGTRIRRRDFIFRELMRPERSATDCLFDGPRDRLTSDRGDPAFIPEPVREFPLTHYLRVADADESAA